MESRKRKPFSDLTNKYNLIDISVLRNRVAASSNSSSTNQKLCSESSNKSNSSIGSSNVSATLNSKTVQFRNPPRRISSIASPEGGASFNRRQIIEKSKKEREADVVVSCTPVEKRKDKGKAIAVPFSSPPTGRMNDNPNEISNHITLHERQKQKGVANLSCSSGSVETVKESEEGILNTYNRSFDKTEKGKEILNSSACGLGKQIEIGKGIADKSCCSPRSSIAKIGKEFCNTSSFLVERGKDERQTSNTFNLSHEKTREKGKAILQTSEFVEIAKHKGSFAEEAVKTRRKSKKKKNDAGDSSLNNLNEDGDSKSSKSWTDPHPRRIKKRFPRIQNTSELLQDFIEQQKSYFKEVDEFELPVEEVSQDELD